MSEKNILAATLLLITIPYIGFSQRGHEIQFQTGYFRNWGVMYYDYLEGENSRHNYEFDPVYDADLLSISWSYPVNAYFDLGFTFTKSYDASFELQQAESFFFDLEEGSGPHPGQVFAGLTDLESKYFALGPTVRINHLIKSNKYKYYVVLNPAIQILENSYKGDDAFETTDEGLREALINDFTGKEYTYTMGLGFGVSYPLRNGINIKILEVYNRYIFNQASSNYLSSSHSLEIRTGISYQFFRKI